MMNDFRVKVGEKVEIVLQLGHMLMIVLYFSTLAFQNGLKYCNFDFSRLIGNHFSISHKNMVRFAIVKL